MVNICSVAAGLVMVLSATCTMGLPLSVQQKAFQNDAIAFAAHRLHDVNLAAGQTLIFDGVTTNAGAGYDQGTGIFTCPADGLYFFTVNILSHLHHPFTGRLVLDGKTIAGVYAVGASETVDDQSTVSTIIHCTEGQAVSLISKDSCYINGERDPMTNFNGFLIAADTTHEALVVG